MVVGVVVGGGERCRGGRVKDVSNIYIYISKCILAL